jgi:prolyl-tRNA editing enzyme YbaK/EbsC (Cys-tRNA(Pro) deacylase)
VFLFITAGGRTVDLTAAAALAGEGLGRATPDAVRAATGFTIGGVAPLGHPAPLPVWFDRRLLAFDRVWAAAGTPRHVFPADPRELARAAGAEIADFSM